MFNANRDLSDKAGQHISDFDIKSSNKLKKGEARTLEQREYILKKLTEMRNKKSIYSEFSLKWIKEIAYLAIKYKLGNCCEQACIAFCYLIENAPSGINIELFNLPFSDHCFVVIGRTKGEPYNLYSWNQETVICDPWAEEYYALKNINLTQHSQSVVFQQFSICSINTERMSANQSV